MERLKLAAPPMPSSKAREVADGRKRKCHIGSGIAQHADTLADKDLVHDIIKRADQKTYDGRDAEFCN